MRYVVLLLLLSTPAFAELGNHGSSLRFGGVGDSITFTFNSGLAPDSGTVEAWVKLSSSQAQTLCAWGDGTGGNNRLPALLARYTSPATPMIYLNGAYYRFFNVTTSAVDSVWHYMVWYFNFTDITKCTLYIDNTVQTVGTTLTTSPSSSRSKFRIGAMCDDAQVFPLFGYLDEFRLYSRKLTANERVWNYRHPGKPLSRDSMKLWLQLNEYSGSTAYDSSGLANNGTIVGATWSTETPVTSSTMYMSSAVDFGYPAGGWINCGKNVHPVDSVSLECWVYPYSLSGVKTFVMIGNQTVPTTPTRCYLGAYSNKLKFGIAYPTSGELSTASTVSSNTWYHMVGTYKKGGGANNWKFYVNGTLTAQSSAYNGDVGGAGDTLYLGWMDGGGQPTFSCYGRLQEVRVYERVLSQTEVTAHYNNRRGWYGTAESQLLAGYHLSEGSGSTFTDYSGNGHTGNWRYRYTPSQNYWSPGKVPTP